jgi:hypothetical protein
MNTTNINKKTVTQESPAKEKARKARREENKLPKKKNFKEFLTSEGFSQENSLNNVFLLAKVFKSLVL